MDGSLLRPLKEYQLCRPGFVGTFLLRRHQKNMVTTLRNLMVLAKANWKKRKAPKEMLKSSQICRRQINGLEDKLDWKLQIYFLTKVKLLWVVHCPHLYTDFVLPVWPSIKFQVDLEMHSRIDKCSKASLKPIGEYIGGHINTNKASDPAAKGVLILPLRKTQCYWKNFISYENTYFKYKKQANTQRHFPS